MKCNNTELFENTSKKANLNFYFTNLNHITPNNYTKWLIKARAMWLTNKHKILWSIFVT